MSNEQETIADIVAQIRAAAYIQTADTPRSVLQLADRIAAAAKREECELLAQIAELRQKIDDGKFFTPKAARDAIAGERPLDEMLKAPLPTGNSAAMRAAIEKAIAMIFCTVATGGTKFKPVVDVLEAARSAKPRNCDRFNSGDATKDAADAYDEWQRHCDDPLMPPSCKVESAFRQWLFAPAAERKGESDGK